MSIRKVGWFLIYLGALGIIGAALFMIGHLAAWKWTKSVTPGKGWETWVNRHPNWVLSLWALEIWVANRVRGFLIEYVGDVAAYIAAHTVSKFWELRQQIWQTAMKVARAVYRARTADDKDFLYQKVIVVGHSLGSVIGYDVLNGMLIEGEFSGQQLDIAKRTRMFLTFGSPLDKTAFVFRTQQDMESTVREVAGAAVQPMIVSYHNRPEEWINLWSRADIISGHLDYYDPPTLANAKVKAHCLDANGVPLRPDSRAVKNYIDPDARTPLAAHVEYWNGRLFANELVRAITT